MAYEVLTYSGAMVNVIDPDVNTIRLIDIAHHLSNMPRFSGGTHRPLSVARHSMNVAMILERHGSERLSLYGLLHDAHEYVLGDIPSPVKQAMRSVGNCSFDLLARQLDKAIYRMAGLPEISSDDADAVKHADSQVLLYEAKHFMVPVDYDWGTRSMYDGVLFDTESPDKDRSDFIRHFQYLSNKMGE